MEARRQAHIAAASALLGSAAGAVPTDGLVAVGKASFQTILELQVCMPAPRAMFHTMLHTLPHSTCTMRHEHEHVSSAYMQHRTRTTFRSTHVHRKNIKLLCTIPGRYSYTLADIVQARTAGH